MRVNSDEMVKKPGVPVEPGMHEHDSGMEATLEASQSRTLPVEPRGRPNETNRDPWFSFQRGERLGRFLIVDKLGDGAMGEVVSAYDPDLDRKVAIKVLRAEVAEGESATHGQQRLVREAQAMAKLSHPNVVTVYEVGTLSDRVFIAMEFIDGVTLSAWLEQGPHPWKDVIGVFEQAGRGLAAAHGAGLVHRDFKPDNVLIRKNGVPAVADFGLASAAGIGLSSDQAPPDSIRAAHVDRSSLNMTLTRTGQLLGTPAYMSPEQFAGTKVDERADQFSFCVALYEALHGVAPFEGSSMPTLYKSIMAGEVKSPAVSSKVPKWVSEALSRGLRPAPSDRFPTMDALLAALTKDPAEKLRKRILMGSVGLVLIMLLSIIAGSAYKSWHDRPCAGVAGEMQSVWDDSTRGAVKQAFAATGRAEARDTFERVDRAMSSYVSSWVTMRRQACEATFVRQEQSEMLLDLRVQCLHRRREEADAVAKLLARADRALLDNAVEATIRLTPLEACADTDALLAAVPPPEDPVVRAKVEALRAQLDKVAALNMANTKTSFQQGSKIADEVERQAQELDYRPIQAEALRWKGDMQYGSGDLKGAEATFGLAILAAAEARDDRLEAVILARLLKLLAYDQGRTSEALVLVPVAEAAAVRVRDERLRSQVVFENAFLVYQVGRADDAQREGERAAAIAKNVLGEDSADVAEMTDFVGALLARKGQFDEALRFHERAKVSMEKALGPSHNRVAEILNNLCKAYKDAGQYEKGRPVCEQSIDIAVKALGAGFQGVGCTRAHYAEVLCGMGQYEQGVKEARSALTLLEKAVGSDHRWVVASHTALGVCLVGAGKPDEAIEPLQRALTQHEQKPGHPLELAKTRFAMGQALWDSGRDEVRARTLASQAEQEYAKAPGQPRTQLKTIRAWIAAHPR